MFSEVKRKLKTKKTIQVMDDEIEALVFTDELRLTILNPFTQKEEALKGKRMSYFAEGIGLVEWHSLNNKIHYRLEQVLTQQEWIKMIAR
jgi:hypothetical protein